MKIKRHCKNCGAVIDMSKERHYVAVTRSEQSFSVSLSAYKITKFDAFDCQECGCQYLAGVREDRLEES